ncbi:alpha/beta fold hydrolase [Amycolatopsis thermophila]|uniref:Pimeloyl-ACP methyl ester carboxylesterase n=1 Tax=Amycolatopsis thermophila TaxID=206084 RepID=A0ABU0EVA1_9PSEU|nr:alpha/beta fold hydrolase [Amycolatopsis thermophila]MDQ0379028.1 pimeloyl-ACP methyl ester carboxylesterase [Amycolatopsis thermophila]
MRARVGGFRSAAGRARYDAVYDEGLRAMPEPAAVHDVPTAFGRVRVYRFGARGDPLVLLPGRGGTSVMFRTGIPALAGHHRVHTVDLLGEPGRSVQSAPIRDAADHARWLDETLAGLGLDRVHLYGVSFGGWLACNQAVRRPGRVASVTLIDPVATFAPMPLGLVLRAVPVQLPYVSSWARPRFLAWIDGQRDADPADHVEGRLISAGLQHFRIALPVPRPFRDDELRGIAAPVLAIIAGRSVVHDPWRALARARSLLPRGEAELWPEATHAVPGQAVGERALRFLAENRG